jgi:hypothetical protein
MGVERKSSARSQTDAIDPEEKSQIKTVRISGKDASLGSELGVRISQGAPNTRKSAQFENAKHRRFPHKKRPKNGLR